MGQARFFRQFPRVFELIGIAVYADDPGTGVAGNLQQRPANPAPKVGDDHSGSKFEYLRQIALVAGNRFLEALSGDAGRKMKGPAPSIFVEIRDQVVVEVGVRLVVSTSTLQSAALGFLKDILVFADGRSDTGSSLKVLQYL